MTTEATPLEELIELLVLDRVGDDMYRGRTHDRAGQPVYGGQIISQALLAAGWTVPDNQQVHSLHAYFHQRAVSVKPISYQVSRVRDSRTFTSRRVCATQDSRVILTLLASFHRAEQGPVHQDAMPAAAKPEDLPTYPERLAKAFNQPVMPPWQPFEPFWQPFDMRFTGPLSLEAAEHPSLRTNKNLVWMRAAGSLPPNRQSHVGGFVDLERASQPGALLHACLLTYISDITLLDTIMTYHGLLWGRDVINGVSLDHSLWFHRPFRVDEWLLYAQETPVAYGARGMSRGQVFTRDGHLVASVAQEGLIRVANLDHLPTE